MLRTRWLVAVALLPACQCSTPDPGPEVRGPSLVRIAGAPVAQALGSAVTLEVASEGDGPDAQLWVSATAPGEVPPSGLGPRYIIPGSAPPTGARRWLAPGGTWSDVPVGYRAASESGAVSFSLPEARAGLWRLDVGLSEGERTIARDIGFLLVNDGPALSLSVNGLSRHVGDKVRASVRVAGGGEALLVRPLLQLPDGGQRMLPEARGPGVIPVGAAEVANVTVLDGDLSAHGAGNYLLSVRAFAADGGELVALAEAGLSVCEQKPTLRGRLEAAGGAPLLGGGGLVRARSASGEFVDIQVQADGAFAAPVSPDYWVLQGEYENGDGFHAPVGDVVATVECGADTNGVTLPLQEPFVVGGAGSTTQPLESSPPSARQDRLECPPEKVGIWVRSFPKNIPGMTASESAQIAPAFLKELQNLLGNTRFKVFSEESLSAEAAPSVQQQALGEGSGDVNQFIQVAAGARAQLVAEWGPVGRHAVFTTRMTTLPRIDRLAGAYLKRELPDGSAFAVVKQLALDTARALIADAGGPDGLYAKFEAGAEVPRNPDIDVSLSNPGPVLGENVTATVTLFDARGCSFAPEGKTVTVKLEGPSFPLTTQQVTVDRSGVATLTFGVGNRTGRGSVTATFERGTGASLQTFPSPPKRAYYLVQEPSNLKLGASRARLYPGEEATLVASYQRGGQPVTATQVTVSTPQGTLTPGSELTDADGRAGFIYRAGTPAGRLVPVDARAPSNAGEPPPRATYVFEVEAPIQLQVTVEPTNTVLTGSTVEIVARVDVGNGTYAGIPVSFATDNGTLASNAAVTDDFGFARVRFSTPAAGAGSAVITVKATLSGTTVTSTAPVSWRAACQSCPFQVTRAGQTQVDVSQLGYEPYTSNDNRTAVVRGYFGAIGRGQSMQYSSTHLVAWSVTGGGTITASGTLTAGQAGGQWEVVATSLEDPGKTLRVPFWVDCTVDEVLGAFSGTQSWDGGLPGGCSSTGGFTPSVLVELPAAFDGGDLGMAPPQPWHVRASWQYAGGATCTYSTPLKWYAGFSPPLANFHGCRIIFEDYDPLYYFNYDLFHATVTGPGIKGLIGVYRTMSRVTDGGSNERGYDGVFRVQR